MAFKAVSMHLQKEGIEDNRNTFSSKGEVDFLQSGCF
jgi:hypothetical protein